MDRPVWTKSMGRSSRTMTRLWREQAAWDMAHMRYGYVDERDFDDAYALLARCIRFALADQRMDETETEANWNSPERLRRAESLERRMGRLNDELAKYGCALGRAHSIYDVYVMDDRWLPKGSGLLHFFD